MPPLEEQKGQRRSVFEIKVFRSSGGEFLLKGSFSASVLGTSIRHYRVRPFTRALRVDMSSQHLSVLSWTGLSY